MVTLSRLLTWSQAWTDAVIATNTTISRDNLTAAPSEVEALGAGEYQVPAGPAFL